MTAWVSVGLVALLGWGIWRRLARFAPAPGAITGAVLFGVVANSAWLAVLELVRAPWSTALLLLAAAASSIAGATAAATPDRTADRDRRWFVFALLAVAPRAILAALNPAFGWDFRYAWGLKARVFALASGHDGAWLAWPGNSFTNPEYPPLWCDLLAAGARLGAPVDEVAAAWQAVLVVALAAACWEAAAGAPARVRALAAVAGGWAPVILWPRYSGYAEPLLAFLAATALGLLARQRAGGPGGGVALAVSVAALALVKNEGVALAAGVVLGAAAVAGMRRALAPALALAAAVGAWYGFLLTAGIGSGQAFAGIGRAGAHLAELPAALAGAFKPKYAVVALLWLLVLPALRGPARRGVRIALAAWAVVVALAYLATPFDLRWHLFTSLDRVLAAPLAAAVALALGAGFSEPTPAGARSSPGR